MKTFFLNMWRIGRWILLIILALFIALVIYRIPVVGEKERSDQAVAFINAQILSMEDVTGERLPPTPDPELADATIEGIDANKNGIRDDVELAIFDMYPGDKNIKIRAALLQYATGRQMYLTGVFNTDTWIATVKHESKGIGCMVDVAFEEYVDIKDQIGKSDEWIEFVNDLTFNSDERTNRRNEVSGFETVYVSGDSETCDVDLKIS